MTTKFDRALIPPSPDFCLEDTIWRQGIPIVAGVDEAGRGALAGPVAAGAVVFPPEPSLIRRLQGVRDSKQMSPAEREAWALRLPDLALTWSVGFASQEEIDNLGILPATRLAILRALDALRPPPQHLLLDYLPWPDCTYPATPLVKGDCRSLSIAAASIIAKTARDEILRRLDQEYPGYGFARHKGYGTAAHRAAIASQGLSPVHRKSFRLAGDEQSFREMDGE